MWLLTAVLSALLFGIATVFFKMISRWGYPYVSFLGGVYLSGSLCFAGLLFFRGGHEVSAGLLIAALVVAFGSAGGNWLFVKSLDYGPMSLTSPLINLNSVYVVIMSVVLFGETLSRLEISAIMLLLVAVALFPIDPEETISIKDRKWYPLVILTGLVFFLRNGGLKVTGEIGFSNTSVLLYAYLASLAWFAVQSRVRDEQARPHALSSWGLGLLTGFFSFGGMQLYVHSLRIGPASIVAPIFSTYSLIAAILAIVFMGERLSKLQAAALVLFFAAIIALRAV